jgi:hypothetical protein
MPETGEQYFDLFLVSKPGVIRSDGNLHGVGKLDKFPPPRQLKSQGNRDRTEGPESRPVCCVSGGAPAAVLFRIADSRPAKFLEQ